MVSNTGISISLKKDDPILSKEQKQFNRLIKDIDKERSSLIAWKDLVQKYHQTYVSELCPLLNEMRQLKINLVKLLDQNHTSGKLNKTEKTTVTSIICSMIDNLINPNDIDELKDIYNKYTDSDFDQEIDEEIEVFKNMVAATLGVELGDDFKMDSPEEVMAKIFQQMKQKSAQGNEPGHKKETRKKSAKTIEKEKRVNEESLEISQSIKDVYRKLAIFLHPDKEMDPIERERKTILIQRVNDAYTKRDLLKLLELQLEIEQIDQASINTINSERLKTYNKILREQLNSIKQELDGVQIGFRVRFNLQFGERLKPAVLLKDLRCDIDDLKTDLTYFADDLVRLQEFGGLKSWLKSYKKSSRINLDDDVVVF